MAVSRVPFALISFLFLLAPSVSQAAGPAIAYTTADLNMRAGPGTNYQVLATVPRGGGVTVFGCTPDRGWCDAAFVNVRGWVSGRYLAYGAYPAYPAYPVAPPVVVSPPVVVRPVNPYPYRPYYRPYRPYPRRYY